MKTTGCKLQPVVFYICSMIMYNVTIKVEHSIAADWLQWMKDTHMPQLMTTGCFSAYRLYRLLDQDETEGPTYCAQYTCDSMEDYQRYIGQYADAMRNETQQHWGGRYIAFRTLMQQEA